MRSERSSTTTRLPCFPASIAHISPAAPAPRITTSKVWVTEDGDLIQPSPLANPLDRREWRFRGLLETISRKVPLERLSRTHGKHGRRFHAIIIRPCSPLTTFPCSLAPNVCSKT